MNQSRLAAVGAFVTAGILLFAVGLFLIGDRRLLFKRQFELKAQFGKVTGLQVGTKVRVAGLDAGEVLELVIPSRPSEKFVVRMRVQEALRQLVRTDSTCSIQTDGLVGSAFIQISRGTDQAAVVEPGSTIMGNDPIEFADLIEEGRNTFRTVSAEMIDLKDHVTTTVDTLTETVRSANEILEQAGADLKVILKAAGEVTRNVQAVVDDSKVVFQRVKNGEGTVGRLLTDDTMYERARTVADQAEKTIRNLQEASDRARQAVDDFTGEGGGGAAIAAEVRITLAQTQEVMSDLAESTEALKRSWPFKGYFQQRGFYDLDSLTAAEYRKGALEGGKRTALRVWIEAGALFASNQKGEEYLTEEGRKRIDSAMADLLRFPRDSPLVVEGYVTGEAVEPLLKSEDRAMLVRDYLIDKFRRRVSVTGTMPLGLNAEGSPSGDGRWSGVALALFVRKDALTTVSNGPSR
jgi:phospholipid/cholesterol/gamma-HCH transport system substrate-binding protein